MRGAVLLLLVLAGSALGFAQETADLTPRRVLLSVGRAPGSEFSAGDALMILRSVHQRLQEAEPDVVFVEPAGASASTPEGLTELAAGAGADGWVRVDLDGTWASARLRVRAHDGLENAGVADVAFARATWGSPAGLAEESWREITQAIAGKYPMKEGLAAETGVVQRARLTIHALPGTVITGLGAPPLRVEADGAAFRELPLRREYAFRADLPGYLPVTTRIYHSAEREIIVQQAKVSTWGVELSLSDSRAPGLDASVYFPGSPLFARGGFSTYALGLALDDTGILLDMPLTCLALQLGAYLSPQDRLFRFYLAVGGFVRLVHAPETRPVLDRLAPAGFRLVVGTEVPVSGQGTLYLELTPTVYATDAPDALRATLGDDRNVPGWVFTPSAALSLLSFRVGYRWRPA